MNSLYLYISLSLFLSLQVDGFFTLLFGLASINTLTVISITRYVKGCHPSKGQSWTLWNELAAHAGTFSPFRLASSHSCSSYLTEVCFWCKWSLITCCSPGNNYHLSMTISPLPTYYVNFRDILYFQLQVTLKNVLTIWKLHPAIAFFVSVAFSHVLWFVINPTYINLWDFFTCGLFNHQHLWCTWRTIHCCMQQNTSI